MRTRLAETRLQPAHSFTHALDCAAVTLGPHPSALLWFVTFKRELPAQRRGGRDHCFVVIDRRDVDKSRRFHAYSQRRFIENTIVQHRLLLLIADIVGFEGSIAWDHSKPDGAPRKLLDSRRMRSLGWPKRSV